MNMLNKTLFASLFGGVFAALPISHAYSAEYTMQLSHQFPPSHQMTRVLEDFASDVSSSTGGKVEVQLFGSDQLFKSNQNHAAVARGQIQAAGVVSFQWGATIPEVSVLTLPYIMSGWDKVRKFPQSELATELNKKIDAKGVKNIAWLYMSHDTAFTSASKPLLSAADFNGVKMRGLNKMMDSGLSAMGAAPISMPGSEVYQALQTGVIDAALVDSSSAYVRKYYEVQKYATLSPLMAVHLEIFVNPKWWSGLPAELQSDIEGAAHRAEQASIDSTEKASKEAIEQLQSTGMSVHVQSPEEVESFKQVMQPAVMKEFRASTDDADHLIELINKM